MAIRMFEAAEDFLESERLNSAEYPNGSEQGDFDGNSSDDSALDVATGFSRLPRKSVKTRLPLLLLNR